MAVPRTMPEALVVGTAWLYASAGRNFVDTMLRPMRQAGGVRFVDDQTGTPTSAASLAGGFGMAIKQEAAALGRSDPHCLAALRAALEEKAAGG